MVIRKIEVVHMDPRWFVPLVTKEALILGVVRHPRDGALGALIRFKATGCYAHAAGGVVRTLPQREAAEAAERLAN